MRLTAARLALCGALALPTAALGAVALVGRTTLAGMSLAWLQTFLAAWCVIATWQVWQFSRGREGLGPLPAAVFSSAALVVLYASDGAYHAWVYSPGPKALALSACALLVWYGGTLVPPVGLVLGATGVLHALSFSQVATDDLIRYWGIADGLVRGAGYSVTAGVPGSAEFFLVDMPLLPLALVPSFGLLGHRYAAAHAPLVVANVALPVLFYALARAAGAARLWALALTLLVISLPQYQIYTLGAAQPDPLWAALLAGQLWLAFTLSERQRSLARWIALGAVSAAVVLTRPEGAIYTGLLFLGLVWWRRRAPLGVLLAGAVGVLPAVVFALTLRAQFGILWPAGGWTNVASARYLLPNLEIVVRRNLPAYAEVLGLPAPGISGPMAALAVAAAVVVGCVRLWHVHPGLRGVPVAVATNFVVILTSPTDLGADRLGPATLFRHASVCVPALVALLAPCVPRHGEIGRARAGRILGPVVATLAVGVLALELVVLGSTAARVGAGKATVLTSDPYVLVPDLWRMADALPVLPFRPGPGRGTEIDRAFDYMGFRARLFAEARTYDLHVNDVGRSFTLAALLFGVTGLVAVALAREAGDEPPRHANATERAA